MKKADRLPALVKSIDSNPEVGYLEISKGWLCDEQLIDYKAETSWLLGNGNYHGGHRENQDSWNILF